jgi:hypothetical protein
MPGGPEFGTGEPGVGGVAAGLVCRGRRISGPIDGLGGQEGEGEEAVVVSERWPAAT